MPILCHFDWYWYYGDCRPNLQSTSGLHSLQEQWQHTKNTQSSINVWTLEKNWQLSKNWQDLKSLLVLYDLIFKYIQYLFWCLTPRNLPKKRWSFQDFCLPPLDLVSLTIWTLDRTLPLLVPEDHGSHLHHWGLDLNILYQGWVEWYFTNIHQPPSFQKEKCWAILGDDFRDKKRMTSVTPLQFMLTYQVPNGGGFWCNSEILRAYNWKPKTCFSGEINRGFLRWIPSM